MFVAERGAGDEREAQAGRAFLNDNIPKTSDRENEDKMHLIMWPNHYLDRYAFLALSKNQRFSIVFVLVRLARNWHSVAL